MRQHYKDWMLAAGWQPVGKSEGGSQEFIQNLGDRTLVVFARIIQTPDWLKFDHGAKVSFDFFNEALDALYETKRKKNSYSSLMSSRNDWPMHFKQNGFQGFIKEQTQRLIDWANSIDPVAELMVIADQNRSLYTLTSFNAGPITDVKVESVSPIDWIKPV